MGMKTLNYIELQNLKNLIQGQEINYEKLMNYSDSVVDPQIKQVLNRAAQEALNNKQKLISIIKV